MTNRYAPNELLATPQWGGLTINSLTMDRFYRNVDPMLVREGFWVHHRSDAGGETYRGIARNFWPAWEGWKIIDAYKASLGRPMRRNERIVNKRLDALVYDFYRVNFWEPIYADDIWNESMVDLLFDSHVLLGKRGVKFLQQAINDVGGEPKLRVDWAMGPKTLRRLHQVDNRLVFEKMKQLREAHHIHIAATVPNQDDFIDGWLHRVRVFEFSPITLNMTA